MMADQLPDAGTATEEPDSPGTHYRLDISDIASLAVDVERTTLWQGGHLAGMDALNAQLQKALYLAAKAAGLTQGVFELSIALVDDARIHDLNKTWRGKDKPTNVLSFPGAESAEIYAAVETNSQLPILLGDIVIAFETVCAEARAQNKTPMDHFLHLLVHGFLHLCGYDHVTDEEAERMEALETFILADMDIAAPYRRDERV